MSEIPVIIPEKQQKMHECRCIDCKKWQPFPFGICENGIRAGLKEAGHVHYCASYTPREPKKRAQGRF